MKLALKSNTAPGLPPVPKQQQNNNLLTYLDELKSKDLIKEIQSVKPDHEQRKLAIEVRKNPKLN